jgi:hypothetical protein
MKILILRTSLIICSLTLISRAAQTINFSSLTNSTIVDSTGTPLDSSYVFEFGAFNQTFIPTSSNMALWEANWNVFYSTAYSYNATSGSYFTGTQDVKAVPNYETLFQNLPAYIFVRNSADTEFFLATASSKPEIDPWVFPVLVDDCCSVDESITWSMSDFLSSPAGDTPVWGGQSNLHSGGTYNSSFGPSDLQTHVFVPELSSCLMALLGVGSLAFRRVRSNVG